MSTPSSLETQKVRREIEHIRRNTSPELTSGLNAENIECWLSESYYDGHEGKSVLEMFLSKYPANRKQVAEYISRKNNNLRLTRAKYSNDV